MINPATFILMVIIGASPPQQRGTIIATRPRGAKLRTSDRMCAGIACRHIEIATSRKWRVLPEAGIPFLGRVSRSKAKRITSSPC
jgi:hypothetical protein